MNLRRSRWAGLSTVWFFLALVVTVSVQHRLAEADLNDDRVCTIQSDEVDGDELLSRLVLADDLAMPTAPRQEAVVQWLDRIETVADIFATDRPIVGSRAPPPRPSSA